MQTQEKYSAPRKLFTPEHEMYRDTVTRFLAEKVAPHQEAGLIRERRPVALRCVVALEAALEWTVTYVKERNIFGKALIENQHIRFKLAEIKTLSCATRSFIDDCLAQFLEGKLTVDGAAMAKYWASEATRAIDDLLQFFGGYGYMREYPIARAYTDVRPNRIWGGSNEIVREVIARTL